MEGRRKEGRKMRRKEEMGKRMKGNNDEVEKECERKKEEEK